MAWRSSTPGSARPGQAQAVAGVAVHAGRCRNDVLRDRAAGRSAKSRTSPDLKRRERLQALSLRAVRMQRRGRRPAASACGDAVGAVLGAREKLARFDRRIFQQMNQRRDLATWETSRRPTASPGRPASIARRSPPAWGSFKKFVVSVSISFDIVAEKSSVCRARQSADDPADAAGSPCRACDRLRRARAFAAGEVDVALLHQIEQPSRRGDDDVDAVAQRLDLRAFTDAAEDRRACADRQMLAVGAHVLLDLHHQLARRREHEHAPAALRRVGAGAAASIGSANAAVLPVPVCAMPIRSRPARIAAESPAPGSASARRSLLPSVPA